MMETLISGLVVVVTLAYFFVKGKGMTHPGGACRK